MKKLFFMLIFSCFLSKNAYALTCKDIKSDVLVFVEYSFGKLNYDFSKTTSEITSMAKNFDLVKTNHIAEGLSTINLNYDISVYTQTQQINDKNFCAVPVKVNVSIVIENPTIYISNSLEKDSCKYNIVMRHEKTHQQINIKTLEYYLPILKAAITNIIKKQNNIPITDINRLDQATIQITEKYTKDIKPLIDYIKKEISQQQQRLDNMENYKFESKLCRN